MKIARANKPHHGLGEFGRGRQRAPLKAGAHMPMRHDAGYDDARGYQGGDRRRLGEHTGSAPKADSRRRKGPEGNGKGSPPPKLGKGEAGIRGAPESHLGTSGRGDKGRLGKSDAYKGRPSPLTEDPSHSWFEKLGAD